MRGTGWILDVHADGGEVALWVKRERGGTVRLAAPYRPPFYVLPRTLPLGRLLPRLRLLPGVGRVATARRSDVWTGREAAVAEVHPTDPARMEATAARVRDDVGTAGEVCTCDVALETRFLIERGLFPLARVRFTADDDGRLRDVALDGDAADAMEYPVPRLEVVEVARGRSARAACIGRDPDVVITRGPCADIHMVSREPVEAVRRRARSYISYGRVVYKPPFQHLHGRWHVDGDHSFFVRRCGLEGLIELSRLSCITPQRMAHTSPGTAISAMEVATALRHGMLVPWRKGEPEAFKTAWQLVQADRGGLVLEPVPGAVEQVAELDFASMYPTIMDRHNISPETVQCACCEDDGAATVPVLGYHLCSKRRGLVPETIAPLLERRRHYKRRARATRGAVRVGYERRQQALKWMLVTCFGYLGYRNARFGRIEAHESVTAFGRDKLVRAARMAEEAGFAVVHGIVDCLWLRHEDGNTLTGRENELADLASSISSAVDVELELEGVYGWLAFSPSRLHPEVAAANRYFGRYVTGELKVRGIEARRRDAPGVVRRLQARILGILACSADLAAVRDALPGAVEVLRLAVDGVRSGDVRSDDLEVCTVVSRSDYRGRSPTAVVATALRDEGVELLPGQKLRYVWGAEGRPVPASEADGYAPDRYTELLLRSAGTLLAPFGLPAEALARHLAPGGRQLTLAACVARRNRGR